MEKQTRNLVLAVMVGVFTGLITDSIIEYRSKILGWVQVNPVLAFLFFVVFVLVLYLLLAKKKGSKKSR